MQDNHQAPIIIARDVNKWYGHFHALKGINMEIQKGEVVVIFGPSGSGKSTFIRTINRLEEHQHGQIIVDGSELARSGMTMLVVTHEMGFARAVAHRMYFFDEGQIVETGTPKEIFEQPREERTKVFLSQILSH